MEKLALEKSKKIYDVIDQSEGFYICTIKKDCRSKINVPFRICNSDELERQFLSGASERGMLQLKGHWFVHF